MKPISTDEELVRHLDELKFNMGAGFPYSPMRKEFNKLLNQFIKSWNLDSDPHAFASLPQVDTTFKFNVGDAVEVNINSEFLHSRIVRNYAVIDHNNIINRYVVELDAMVGSEIDVSESEIKAT